MGNAWPEDARPRLWAHRPASPSPQTPALRVWLGSTRPSGQHRLVWIGTAPCWVRQRPWRTDPPPAIGDRWQMGRNGDDATARDPSRFHRRPRPT